jgi:two-component system chemotaxis response regulator CheY
VPVPKLLIVDDDRFVRDLLRDLLSPEGYDFCEAQDGEEAIRRVEEERPDVVLLDLLMPRVSGMDALRIIRQRVPASRVVVISSMDSEALVAQAFAAGAQGFVVKPFHPMEIKEAVRKALRSEP